MQHFFFFQLFIRGINHLNVKSIALDVLRHRVIISYEAEAEELTSEDLIEKILSEIPVP